MSQKLNLGVITVEILDDRNNWIPVPGGAIFYGDSEGRKYVDDQTGLTTTVEPPPSEEDAMSRAEGLQTEWIAKGLPEERVRICKAPFRPRVQNINGESDD